MCGCAPEPVCKHRAVTAPSGTNVVLEFDDYRAEVTEVGAGLRTLTRSGVELVAGYGPRERCTGDRGQLLLPWPNRIEGGRYTFGGQDWQLPVSEPASVNAIHGLVRWMAWRLLDSSASSVRWGCTVYPQPGYGGHLELAVAYDVSADGLRVETSVTNVGDAPAPYGAGAHPYLTVGREIDGCELTLPAAQRCPSDQRGLPRPAEPAGRHGFDFRHRRRIGDAVFDDAFTDLERDGDGRAWSELLDPDSGRRARLWVDPSYRWLQVFSGEGQGELRRQALAVEPMTCPPNAFATSLDLVVLQPGETHVATFGIS